MYRKNDSFGDFSLPTQRCFSSTRSARGAKTLFSAYAEVFPYTDLKAKVKEAFLCLRRGVSVRSAGTSRHSIFSLPTQRCFCQEMGEESVVMLFSAYAEVFLALPQSSSASIHFSLPTQRCFP